MCESGFGRYGGGVEGRWSANALPMHTKYLAAFAVLGGATARVAGWWWGRMADSLEGGLCAKWEGVGDWLRTRPPNGHVEVKFEPTPGGTPGVTSGVDRGTLSCTG